MPSKANWREFFRNYLADPLGTIPSPETRTVLQLAPDELIHQRLK